MLSNQEVLTKDNKDNINERIKFRSLILSNPNYFGNLQKSKFKAVLAIQSNTTYEEIGCVGYQPQFNRLDAVIFTKKSYGFGGGICSEGSREYVRFYISYDNGTTWEDEGLASFTARNIPENETDKKRLEYAVSKQIDPKRKFCFGDNVILARAILSWNVAPPANDPHFVPVWGDTHTTHIQVEPYQIIIFDDLLTELKVDAKVAANLKQVMDVTKPVSAVKTALSLPELHDLYKGKKIEPHRYALAHLTPMLEKNYAAENLMSATSFSALQGDVLEKLGINISDILDKFFNVGDGNTSYEELDCVGLNTNQSALVGIIRVKKPYGYSGNPCTSGSREYVAFWGDFNGNGTYETYLGTTSVTVHDIQVKDSKELEYSVFLPVDLDKYRQPCEKGPKIVRIRAIMSWNVAPPPGNPNYVPIWGNREETHILIEPGKVINPGHATPILSSVGDMPVPTINNITGTSTGVGNFTGFVASDSPFGGRVNIAGKVANGSSLSRYRVMKKPHGAPVSDYKPIINDPLKITLVTFSGGILTITPEFPVVPDANGYYAYQDYSSNHFVDGNILVRWYTTDEDHDKLFDIRVDLNVDGNPLHDIHSDVVTILVDNKAPDVDLKIDNGSLSGLCADFAPGTVFTGTFKAVDPHFHSYSFEIQPSVPAGGALPSPASGVSTHHGGTIADPGIAAGVYSLDTTPMSPCGYSLTLHVYDRTNVNSGTSRHYNKTAVGFCVKA